MATNLKACKAESRAEPRLAAEIASLMASENLAGVRLKLVAATYTVTCRDRQKRCATLAEVHSVLRRWIGQP